MTPVKGSSWGRRIHELYERLACAGSLEVAIKRAFHHRRSRPPPDPTQGGSDDDDFIRPRDLLREAQDPHESSDIEAVTMKNGRPATRATCVACGTKKTRFGTGG